MHIDSRLRELLWEHEGFVFTHPPKTAGTSVIRALHDHPGFISLSRVSLSNPDYSTLLQDNFRELLARLRDELSAGRPWVMHVGHQSFAGGWHRDLPPCSTVVIPFRTTQERLRSWVAYFGKVLEWVEGTSFEVTADMRLRYVNLDRIRPALVGGSQHKPDSLRVVDEISRDKFWSWIQIKLDSPRLREQARTDLPALIQSMISANTFYFRDLFPRDFLRSATFRKRTQVIDYLDMSKFLDRHFGLALPRFNSSAGFDIHSFTGLEESTLGQVCERISVPDQKTERILLSRRWVG
jgi:hypothetical protein